jgi:excisionase family DNA binding protein
VTAAPLSHASEARTSRSETLGVLLPPELVETISQRVAEILDERSMRRERVQPLSDYLSVPEAAERLRAKPQRVYDLLSAGRLTRFKDGTRVLVSREELDDYLAGASVRRVAHALPRSSRARMDRRLAA